MKNPHQTGKKHKNAGIWKQDIGKHLWHGERTVMDSQSKQELLPGSSPPEIVRAPGLKWYIHVRGIGPNRMMTTIISAPD